jgi:hypothetical protein
LHRYLHRQLSGNPIPRLLLTEAGEVSTCGCRRLFLYFCSCFFDARSGARRGCYRVLRSVSYPVRLKAFISSYPVSFTSEQNIFRLHTASFSSLTVEISKVHSTPSLSLPLRLEPSRACREMFCGAPSQQAVEGEKERPHGKGAHVAHTHLQQCLGGNGPIVANAGGWYLSAI